VKKYKNVDAASHWISLRPLAALIALAPLLASCASSGMYNMSDEWCARHLEASAARCPAPQELAQRTAENDTRVSGPAERPGEGVSLQ